MLLLLAVFMHKRKFHLEFHRFSTPSYMVAMHKNCLTGKLAGVNFSNVSLLGNLILITMAFNRSKRLFLESQPPLIIFPMVVLLRVLSALVTGRY